MSTILEALAVIKAKDATGGALDGVAAKIGRIARAANALNRDVMKQLSTAQRAEASTSRLMRASTAIGNGTKAAAGAVAAYEGSRAARAIASHTVKSASDRAHEEVRMSTSGMSDKEIAEAGEVAAHLSAKYKSLTQTQIMHTARNIRSVVGSFEEATHIIDPLMKLRVVAEGAHPERKEELGADFDKLVKGMEIKGVTQDLKQFNHYIDGMAKALNVFGDTLRPTDYYEMFKYGRAATTALSDQFMLQTAPTLAQELGGSSAGKALSSFYTQFVGGKMSNKAVAQLEQYGMLDPSKVIKTSTGNVKGVLPGGIIGSEYLQPGKTDPYQWVNKVLLPHLASKGVTDPAQIQEVIAAMASQQTAAQMMAIFATQQKRIDKDAALVKGAMGIDAADKYLSSDPKVLKSAIESQFDNMLGNTAKPFMPAVTGGMNWLASGLSYMSEQATKNPMRSAAGIGWASALAAALSLDSVSSGLSSAGALFRGEGAAAGLRMPLTKLTAMLAPILDIATRSDIMTDLPVPDSVKRARALHPQIGELSSLDAKQAALDSNWVRGPLYDAGKSRIASRRAELESELAALGYGPASLPGRGMVGSSPTLLDDIRAATGGGSKEPVKAEVVGSATLETVVKVEPSPDFLARITQTVNNGINAFKNSGGPSTGTAGSTGRSMPEAGPPQ